MQSEDLRGGPARVTAALKTRARGCYQMPLLKKKGKLGYKSGRAEDHNRLLHFSLYLQMNRINMDEQLIFKKLNNLPEHLRSEVLDFIDFLLTRQKKEKEEVPKPTFGSAKGQFKMAEDFDAPLDDFKEYM